MFLVEDFGQDDYDGHKWNKIDPITYREIINLGKDVCLVRTSLNVKTIAELDELAIKLSRYEADYDANWYKQGEEPICSEEDIYDAAVNIKERFEVEGMEVKVKVRLLVEFLDSGGNKMKIPVESPKLLSVGLENLKEFVDTQSHDELYVGEIYGISFRIK